MTVTSNNGANMSVAIMMGSKSDLEIVRNAFDVLDEFGVPFTARIMSAHRTPHEAAEFAANAEKNGCKVIICAAGMAAHLGGVVAAHTTLPVIGIPMASEPFKAVDSLLATVQMPPGIPVATVGINAGLNAAILATQILALSDERIAAKVSEYKENLAGKITKANEELAQIKYEYKTN
jgi:5-(carboxyamino)imidazole ribonucleotide mutase